MDELSTLLNPEQYDAVTSTEGFVRVIAGAGSGKTRALTYRFAYLVNALGVLPGNILCVTFTNKAANEMRRRIHNLTGDNDTGYINTFHGFCVSILQEDSHAIGYPKAFLVLDNSDIDAMLRIIYEERGLSLQDMTFSAARDMIEIQKLKVRPDYYKDMLNMSLDALKEKYESASNAVDIIFYGYLYQEKKCFGLDYNDLIIFSLYIFEQNQDIRLKWQERLEYIMIDEFQDIDPPQYELMRVLCGYHKNLFVVGDPDQTIYTWRGADIRFLLDFDKVFTPAKTIMMNRNYRSSPEILSVVNSLIGKNRNRIEKSLITQSGPRGSVLCTYADNSAAEAGDIADRMLSMHEAGTPFKQMAVLYRAHYLTRSIEDALRKSEIPYSIYSGVQFYDRAEIKDALSYLRMIVYHDDLSFLRVVNTPKRNIGQRRIHFITEQAERMQCSLYAAMLANADNEIFRGTGIRKFIALIEEFSASYAGVPVSELLSAVLNASGYEMMLRTEGSQDRLDNLAELKQSIFEYETTCGEECTAEHYLSHVALFTNSDTAESGDKVKLMTVHAAKGLEFPYVFLIGMNEGVFPSKKIKTLAEMEEERRLAFVAMTRAENRLFLSEADGRNFDGSPRYPSRFLLDIDNGLLEYPVPPKDSLIAEARHYIELTSGLMPENRAGSAFKPGQKILHEILGAGTIIEVDEAKGFYLIRFDCMNTPRKISFKVRLKPAE